MVDELRELVVVATNRHVGRDRCEIGIRGLTIVQLGPNAVAGLVDPAIEVTEDNEGVWANCGFVNPAFQVQALVS